MLKGLIGNLINKKWKLGDLGYYDMKHMRIISAEGNYIKNSQTNASCMWEFEFSIKSIPNKPESMSQEEYDAIVANADTDYDEIELFYIHRVRAEYKDISKLFYYIYLGYSEDMDDANILSATCLVRAIPFEDYCAKYGVSSVCAGKVEQEACNIFYHTDLTDVENWTLIDNADCGLWGQ